MRSLKRSVVLLTAAAGTTLALSAPAQASDAPGALCRAAVAAVVYSPNTGEAKYVIPAGRDMRVHYRDGNWFYGHGGPRDDDGWAWAGDFSYCR